MLRASALLISMLTLPTAFAAAGKFDFVPATGETRSLMNGGDFRRALEAFDQTLANTAFARSSSGRATRAFLLVQNEMPMTAISSLVNGTKPTALDPALLDLWTVELRKSDVVRDGLVSTAGAWSKIVDNSPVRMKIASPADVARAFARVNALPKTQVDERARVLWQIANLAPLIGDTGSALKALDQIRNSTQLVYKTDIVAIAAARVLYQRDDVDGALHALEDVPKSSNLWVEALEERVWASARRDDFDKAIGGLVTLLSPALDPLVGPEPFFLSNLMSLKTCDYSRLFKTSDLFKARHRERLLGMQSLAGKGVVDAQIFERLDRKGLSIDGLGPMISKVPRASLRDRQLRVAVQSRKQLLKEATMAEKLKDERTSLQSIKAADVQRAKAIARLRVLAAAEVKEYRTVLNKMHILEAEVIERMNLDDNLKGKRQKLAKVEDKGDVLVFPYKSDEVWLDELDNYKARVKECPTLKGAGL